MNLVLFAILFVGAFYTTMRLGIGRTFAWWMLPAVILVNFAKSKAMPGLPNLTSLNMVVYGVVCALPFRWQEVRTLRWGLLDTMMLLMLVPVAVTTYVTSGDPKLAQRQAMEFACTWLFPYLMARVALQDLDARKAALKVLCVCAIVVGCLTAIESSGIKPNFTARALDRLHWDETSNVQVMYRFGLARAIATAGQPIDLGNVGVLVGTMILVLLPATGTSWKKPLPVAGILGSGAMVFGCVSLTAWGAMLIAFAGYFLLSRPTIGKYLVVPILLVEIIAMVGISAQMLNDKVSEERPDDPIAASRWIRVRIIQDAWAQASTSGWFGYGKDLDINSIGVGSVDNSYLLFLMQTGWFSLVMWLVLMVLIAGVGTRVLASARTPSERYPAAAAVAGVLAILFAMYTVFFGFAYAILFCVVLGMLGSMHQMMVKARPVAVSLQGGVLPHGFPVAMAGGVR